MTQTTTEPAATPASDASDLVIKSVGLTKVFRDFWMRNRVRAVDQIDFEVRRGEVFGLLGPNGSGKSTTIKMILGLLHPTSGRVAVLGKPPTDVSIKQNIGYLPEESYLYRFLNARETLDYYGRLFHQDRRQRRKRIDMLLEMVGLDKVQRRPVGEYSKGMQRRIGLAQALINDPELIILDEPTTGLDPIGTRQVKDLLMDLARPRSGKAGKTILLCSHLLADVEDVCDRVSIMFGGKIRREGTVDDLLVQEGRTTIHTRQLTPELIDKVERLLEQHGHHIDRVEQPREKLEHLFLNIVEQALAEGAITSGAGSGGRTAAFLTGEEGEQEGEAVVDRLVNRPEPEAPAPEQPAPQPSAEEAQTKQLMADLQQESRPEPGPAAPAARPEPEADRSVIEGLTGEAEQEASPPRPTEPDSPRSQPKASEAPKAPEAAKPPKTPKPPEKAPPPPSEEKADQDFLNTLLDENRKKQGGEGR